MTDYISREAALDAISEWLMKALHQENTSSYNEGERAAYRTVISEIAELPAADVRPVVRGTWVGIDDYPHEDWECDHCGSVVEGTDDPWNYYNFCPNCGADMREES